MASDDFACRHFGGIQYNMGAAPFRRGQRDGLDGLDWRVRSRYGSLLLSLNILTLPDCDELAPYEAKSSGGLASVEMGQVQPAALPPVCICWTPFSDLSKDLMARGSWLVMR